MSRTIPIALQTHLDGDATTTCHLLRIIPVRSGVDEVGLTDLDRDVTYNDGDGSLNYLAPVGFVPSNTVYTADFGVDNLDANGLFPEYDIPQISEADINAGVYDYARFKLYLVNYEALSNGHVLLLTGKLGQMKTIDGLSFFGESRSLMQQFRQTIVERDSLTCRAVFGSQLSDARFPCGIDATALFVSGSVDSVGAENLITFTDASLTQSEDYFVPGLLEWITGDNAGRQYEVEAFDAGTVTLAFPCAFPIKAGDAFDIRPDCTKKWDGPNSCETYDNRLNFRGEPFIPVADAGQLNVPGAGVGPGNGANRTVQFPGVEV